VDAAGAEGAALELLEAGGGPLSSGERMQRAELLKAAVELAAEEREQLAEELWASLDGDTDEEVQQAWANEIEHRMDEADAGEVKSVPWSEVRAEALDRPPGPWPLNAGPAFSLANARS
jgi:putative addiction module component (TIGR02574 family)